MLAQTVDVTPEMAAELMASFRCLTLPWRFFGLALAVAVLWVWVCQSGYAWGAASWREGLGKRGPVPYPASVLRAGTACGCRTCAAPAAPCEAHYGSVFKRAA